MTDYRAYAIENWRRAVREYEIAEKILVLDPNSTSNRAYYAAFHAVTALFALEGKSFTKHTSVRMAVHNELVKPGRWTVELGSQYNLLMTTRHTGDYGGVVQVSEEEARDALKAALMILGAVHDAEPTVFLLANP